MEVLVPLVGPRTAVVLSVPEEMSGSLVVIHLRNRNGECHWEKTGPVMSLLRSSPETPVNNREGHYRHRRSVTVEKGRAGDKLSVPTTVLSCQVGEVQSYL